MQIKWVARVLACAAVLSSIAAFGAEAEKKVGTAASVDELLGAMKRSGAKVILLNVWSAQCAPCLAEMPVLARVFEKHKNDNSIALLGLCLTGEDGDAASALKTATEVVRKKQVEYSNLLWTGKGEALFDRFNVLGTPTTIFVSADGKVLGDILEMPENAEQAREAIEKGLEKALKK